MDNELYDYIHEVTNYIIERAAAEGSITAFHEREFSKAMDFHEFIYKIIALHVEIEENTADGNDSLYGDDEYAHISEVLGIPSTDIIELVIWFYNCEMMSDGRIIWVEYCPKCGHNELYEREVEGGGIYESYFECVSCGRKYTFEEILDDSDNVLPLDVSKYKEPDPLEGLNPDNLPTYADRDAIYRFRVSRKIIELNGSDTMADLSNEIQQMYGLSDERMSSFFMGRKFFERSREITCPRFLPFCDDESSTAENYEICNLNLYVNQKFLYLNDFMRENRFNIRFIGTR
jgi:uncharacterized Zn finger protein